MDQEEKKKHRQELLKKLHNRVDAKQANRMNKAFKEKRVADLTEQMSNGDQQMKDNIAKVMKKVKKGNKKKKNFNKTMEQRVKDLQGDLTKNVSSSDQDIKSNKQVDLEKNNKED